jgi:hypothetical protein
MEMDFCIVFCGFDVQKNIENIDIASAYQGVRN